MTCDPMPHVWNNDELIRDRRASRAHFVDGILHRGTADYVTLFTDELNVMRAVFEKTHDLTEVSDNIATLTNAERELFRFVSVPPLSSDDSKTVAAYLAEEEGASAEEALARSVMGNYDPVRFSWLGESRAPSETEREAAIRWTCGLYAIQRLSTINRTRAGHDQEAAVRAVVAACGYTEDSRSGTFTMRLLDDMARGTYRKETKLASIDSRGHQTTAKCDVPVRLKDGRLLLIECKVSNSEVNSIKRVERETCGKASGWRSAFGQSIILALVFDGIVSQVTIAKAQEDYGEYVFWGHRLGDLADFIRQCE